MAARDIGGITDPDKIVPRIEKSLLPRTNAAPGGEHDSDYDGHSMAEMGLAKKSMAYTMALTLTSLGMMFVIMILHGFGAYGFRISDAVLTVLILSLSVAPAIRVFGGLGGRALGGK